MTPTFFKNAAAFRRWLAKNHDKATELLVGFHKLGSGLPSITYPEALDEALCVGWIDGVRKKLDETSYTVRFSPRKPKSYWSDVNQRHFERLCKESRVTQAGLAAFEAGDTTSRKYSFENRPKELDPAFETELRANRKAWDWFSSQPPWYRRTCIFWVMSAKKEETRQRRLRRLIEASAHGQRPGLFPKE